jgi:hypothetical protein
MAELSVKQGASRSQDPATAARELYDAIHDPNAALTVIHCASTYDLEGLGAEISKLFGADARIIGCTTAGEITPIGYLQGVLTGVSITGPGFDAVTVRVDDLDAFELAAGDAAAQGALQELRRTVGSPLGTDCFAYLLVDGLACQEESLVSSLYRNLSNIPLFGGSAGDGTRFHRTAIYHQGRFRTNCAVFTLVRSSYPFRVFKTEHFVPSAAKMVVTGADPARRIVTEINGAPAGREYARMVGLEVDGLTPLIFAAHPVCVRVGGLTYIRSIQKVNPDESLTFFCAIDEGIVLTVAEGVGLVDNLEQAFHRVRQSLGVPTVVLGCDCILRNLEADQRGLVEQIGELMTANNVVGFATYGEQFNAMHVNQTFTGVAIGRRPDVA